MQSSYSGVDFGIIVVGVRFQKFGFVVEMEFVGKRSHNISLFFHLIEKQQNKFFNGFIFQKFCKIFINVIIVFKIFNFVLNNDE
jgi:hypothetical protein